MLYDVGIIGGGPAGYRAAERAGEAGLKVLLAEKNNIGGVCLNEGCIPTKALLASSRRIHADADGTAGRRAREHADALANKAKVVKTLVGGVSAVLRAKKVTVLGGSAEVVRNGGRFEVVVEGERHLARNILLATGSVPALPPIPGLEEAMKNGFALTSREILDLETLPAKLIVVGGGAIGLEMAAYFQAMGSSVAIVEALPAIGGPLEPEAAQFLQTLLKKKRIAVHTNARVTSFGVRSVHVETHQGARELDADLVLLCTGRRPAATQFKDLGVHIENGAVGTDERMRTSVAGVYAAGDINGRYMLAHVAYREAEVAVNNMAGIDDAMEYRAVPGVMYTSPEVAYAGMSERVARERYANVSVAKTGINMSGRHVAEYGLSDGFCKLVADKDRNIVLGGTIVGAYTSEIVYSLGIMIQNKIPIDSLKRTIFAHPTVCEVIREALFSLEAVS